MTTTITITVTNQTGLDAALTTHRNDPDAVILINSPAGTWLTINDSGSASVSASGSASVRASGSASVSAFDSASVSAFDSASVSAFDSASVRAYDSATVSASKFVAVHLHSTRVTLSGGVVIDLTTLDLTDPQTWAEYHGLHVVDGIVQVFKAVNDRWTTDRGIDYSPGALPEAADWAATRDCGNGLHFGHTPDHATRYHMAATRWVRCGVRLADIIVLDDKIKAPRAVTPCVAVDRDGIDITVEVSA